MGGAGPGGTICVDVNAGRTGQKTPYRRPWGPICLQAGSQGRPGRLATPAPACRLLLLLLPLALSLLRLPLPSPLSSPLLLLLLMPLLPLLLLRRALLLSDEAE